MSSRHDGRGHWPAGKRRHQPLPPRQLGGLMRRIARLVDPRNTSGHKGRSVRGVAAAVGVSDRTLRRWLAGEDHPSAEHTVLLQAWLDSCQG